MSNQKLKKLFYSQKENILFYVAGYTDNSDNVQKIIAMLQEKSAQFIGLHSSYKLENVKTFYVTKSKRYKSMRVFYLETSIVPEIAFSLCENCTMMEWIEN